MILDRFGATTSKKILVSFRHPSKFLVLWDHSLDRLFPECFSLLLRQVTYTNNGVSCWLDMDMKSEVERK